MTFNPTVQQRAPLHAAEPPAPATLREAADIVVRCLDPFYTKGKFATKVSESLPRPLRVRSRGPRLRGGLSSCLFFVFLAPQELFKSFARHLSHLLAEGRSQGKGQGKREVRGEERLWERSGKNNETLSLCPVKAEAKALIKTFFSGVERCESEADWKHLKRPQSCKTSEIHKE